MQVMEKRAPYSSFIRCFNNHYSKNKIEGLKIAICGDILHSRVARSNIYLLNMLGAEVNIIAPTNLMPKEIEKFGVNTFTDMKKV